MSKEKSKKNRELNKHIDKIALWNSFDENIKNPEKPLECLESNVCIRDKCDHCMSSLALSEDNFYTCTNRKCGIVYKDIVDQSPEWRYYGADDNQSSDPTRCGMPINPLLKESSFGCQILSIKPVNATMRKIKRYTDWQAMPYKEKSIYDDFQRITIMAQNAGISKKIIDDAIIYHKKITEYEQTFRGNNKDGILAASIYISCRINNCPRTAKELAAIFYLNNTDATNGCKNAQSIINILEKDMVLGDKTTFCKTTPLSFIDRYCSKLNINTELTKLCQFIAIKIENMNYMPENTPQSIAAGIVYFIIQLCNLNISKHEVKNVSEISEVTINKCCKKIELKTNELIPQVIIQKYTKPKIIDIPNPNPNPNVSVSVSVSISV
jgi:transcription initiation factor TFIIB